MSFIIYHNPRCQKSRNGLNYLKEHKIEPVIIDYLKLAPFSEKSLKDLIKKLGIKPVDLVRKQEQEYKQLYKGKDLTDNQWIQILTENPKLIRRPIIVKGNMAIIGDIKEHIDHLL